MEQTTISAPSSALLAMIRWHVSVPVVMAAAIVVGLVGKVASPLDIAKFFDS
jgi:hypothetical protein